MIPNIVQGAFQCAPSVHNLNLRQRGCRGYHQYHQATIDVISPIISNQPTFIQVGKKEIIMMA